MGAVASNQQRALTVCQVGKPLLPPSLQSIWTHLPMLAGWLFDAEECTFGRWQDAGGERIVRDVCLIEQKLTGRWCGGLEAIMGGSFFYRQFGCYVETGSQLCNQCHVVYRNDDDVVSVCCTFQCFNDVAVASGVFV